MTVKQWHLKIDASIVLCVGKILELDCERSLDVVSMSVVLRVLILRAMGVHNDL